MPFKSIQPSRNLVAMAVGGLLLGMATGARAQFSGSAALTSDYVWRGASQTREKPAVQAGLKYAHESGFYASIWGSNVRFRPDNGSSSEFDLMAGWSGKMADDWALDTWFQRYEYPGSNGGTNWNEVNVSVTWRDNYWLSVGHSGNTNASGTRGTYALLGARYPINDAWRVEGTLARYFLDRTYADSYTHGSASVVWAFKAPFEARVTLHGSDTAAKRLFPGMAGTRVELTLQASF